MFIDLLVGKENAWPVGTGESSVGLESGKENFSIFSCKEFLERITMVELTQNLSL